MLRQRPALAVIVACVLGLIAAETAHAEKFMTRSAAISNARFDAVDRYGDQTGITYSSTSASCRPQNDTYDSDFIYRLWVCSWRGIDEEGDVCKGQLRIRGRVGERGKFASLVLRGLRCYYAE